MSTKTQLRLRRIKQKSLDESKKEKERKKQTSKRLFHISIQSLTAAVYTSVVNFINILCSLFSPIFWRQKISNPKHGFVIFGTKILYKKCARKMLMKSTPG